MRGAVASIFVDRKSPWFMGAGLVYLAAILPYIWFTQSEGLNHDLYLFMSANIAYVGWLAWRRTKLRSEMVKGAWRAFAIFMWLRVALILADYPEIGEATPAEGIFFMTVIALVAMVALVWPHFNKASLQRVALDSLWFSLVLILGFWYVAFDPFWHLEELSTVGRVALLASIIALVVGVSYSVNLKFNASGVGFIGLYSVYGSFAAVGILAIYDLLLEKGAIGESRVLELLWFAADLGFLIAVLVRGDIKSRTILNSRWNYVGWITLAPMVPAAVVLFFTAPSDQRIIIGLGSAVFMILAVRTAAVGGENKKLSGQLRDLALTDDLTGLPNRRALDVGLEELAEAGNPVLIYADLDFFKEVNDRFGHAAGDELLRAFSDRLLGCLRTGDKCYRVGGDEFVILADIGEAGRDHVIEALVERVRSTVDHHFNLSFGPASVGITVGVATGEVDGQRLLVEADRQMFRAKSAGRGSTYYAGKQLDMASK